MSVLETSKKIKYAWHNCACGLSKIGQTKRRTGFRKKEGRISPIWRTSVLAI